MKTKFVFVALIAIFSMSIIGCCKENETRSIVVDGEFKNVLSVASYVVVDTGVAWYDSKTVMIYPGDIYYCYSVDDFNGAYYIKIDDKWHLSETKYFDSIPKRYIWPAR